jgi:hypothetical protein
MPTLPERSIASVISMAFDRIGRQRLFAEYVLAGSDRLKRRRVVDTVRRNIGDGIEIAPGERVLKGT